MNNSLIDFLVVGCPIKCYSNPNSFGQVPVLVIFVLKCLLLKNFNLLLHLNNICLFWSKQATNILKPIKFYF